ncbi:hypothetical protein ACLKA6_005905 [Drosophila palustris]
MQLPQLAALENLSDGEEDFTFGPTKIKSKSKLWANVFLGRWQVALGQLHTYMLQEFEFNEYVGAATDCPLTRQMLLLLWLPRGGVD